MKYPSDQDYKTFAHILYKKGYPAPLHTFIQNMFIYSLKLGDWDGWSEISKKDMKIAIEYVTNLPKWPIKNDQIT